MAQRRIFNLPRPAIAVCIAAIATLSGAQTPAGASFTYQGRLDQGGAPATGSYDFEFTLWNAPAAGGQISATQARPAVAVSGGLFSVSLDFGASAFDGDARWLQITVRTAGGGAYTPLSPRVELRPVPYALHAANADPGDELNTGLALSGTNLQVTDAGGTLSANLAPLRDNLGNHTATQNLNMGDFNIVGLNGLTATNPGSSPDGSAVQIASMVGDPGFLISRGDGLGSISRRWDFKVSGDDSFRIRDFTGSADRMVLRTDGTLTATAFVGDGSGLTGIPDGHSLDAFDGFPMNSVFVNGLGNVGMGTGNPEARLHVASAGLTSAVVTEVGRTAGALGGPVDADVFGNIACVASSANDRMNVVSLSDPANPTVIGSAQQGFGGFTDLTAPNSVVISDDGFAQYAWVTSPTSNAITAVNISDPANPTFAAVAEQGGPGGFTDLLGVNDVWISGFTGLAIAHESDALTEFSASIPFPTQIRVFKAGMMPGLDALDGPSALWVDGQKAYVTCDISDSLAIIDLSLGLSVTLINGMGGFTDLNGPSDVIVSGPVAYVAARDDDAITVIDLTDSFTPTQLAVARNGAGGFTDLRDPAALALSGNILMVTSATDNAVTFIDVTDPQGPVQIGVAMDGAGGITGLAGANSIFASGSTAYVTAGAAGDNTLSILDFATAGSLGLIVEDTVRISGGSPDPGRALLATDAQGNAAWGDATPSSFVYSSGTTSVSNSGTGWNNLGFETGVVPGLRAGDRVLILSSGAVEISGGSGTDHLRFRIRGSAAGCGNVFSIDTGTYGQYDNHRNEYSPLSFQVVVPIDCDGDYTFQVQIERQSGGNSLLDDTLNFDQQTLVALRL